MLCYYPVGLHRQDPLCGAQAKASHFQQQSCRCTSHAAQRNRLCGACNPLIFVGTALMAYRRCGAFMLLSFHNQAAIFQWSPIQVLSVRAHQPSGCGMHAYVFGVSFLSFLQRCDHVQAPCKSLQIPRATHIIGSICDAYTACVVVAAGVTEVARCGEGQQEGHGVCLLLVGRSSCL